MEPNSYNIANATTDQKKQYVFIPPPSISTAERITNDSRQSPFVQRHRTNVMLNVPSIPEVKYSKEAVHKEASQRKPLIPIGIGSANANSPNFVPNPSSSSQSGPLLMTPNDPSWSLKTSAADLKQDRINELLTAVRSDVDDYVAPGKATQEEIQNLVESFQTVEEDEEVSKVDSPEGLLVKLLRHQTQGLSFMINRETGKNTNGGILADDMGLGKTIQTLALILSNRPTDYKKKPTLIVAPLALIRQWESEIKSKVQRGKLSVLVHYGPSRTKDYKKLMGYDVVITTYQVMVSEWGNSSTKKKSKKGGLITIHDTDSDSSSSSDGGDSSLSNIKKKKSVSSGPLFEAEFYRVVLDEAQTIKNRTSKASQACSEISAEKRWCLTGTPIQNSVDDLYSLFRFLHIKPYDEYVTFKTRISLPASQNKVKLATRRLYVILKSIMLRRTKNTLIDGKPLLQLPKRTVHNIVVDFSPEEEDFYRAIENRAKVALGKLVKDGTVKKSYTHVLCMLLRLRQACNHPCLVTSADKEAIEAQLIDITTVGEQKQSKEVDDVADLLSGLSFDNNSKKKVFTCGLCLTEISVESIQESSDGPPYYCEICGPKIQFQKSTRAVSGLTISAKMERMMQILEETREKDQSIKTIIFSQFTSMLDLVEPYMKRKDYKFVRYDGSMPNVKREASLAALRDDKDTTVLLISLKCGSLGLNLTVASQVILLDVWWNPSVEDQAIDRSHRIGQTSDVNVYKITVDGTVEDRILVLQEKKRQLAQGALGDDEKVRAKVNTLSVQDIFYLFNHDVGKDSDED